MSKLQDVHVYLHPVVSVAVLLYLLHYNDPRRMRSEGYGSWVCLSVCVCVCVNIVYSSHKRYDLLNGQ